MSKQDLRWVARIACEIPARILSRRGWCAVTVRDLSRMGLRIGLVPEELELPASASIGTLARRLADLLPEAPTLELHHRRLGVLVPRLLRVVRVRPVRGDPPYVELGCLFDRPLDDDEVAALGIALPRAGETLEQALRRQRPHPPRARTPELSIEAQACDANFLDLLFDTEGAQEPETPEAP